MEDLEKILEAANSLVSTEKNLRRPTEITEATEIEASTDQGYTMEPEMDRDNPEPSPTRNPAPESRAPYFFFLATFVIWLVSLPAIYLPVIGWVTPSIPVTLSNTTLMIFLVSAGLASFSSLLIGLQRLGK